MINVEAGEQHWTIRVFNETGSYNWGKNVSTCACGLGHVRSGPYGIPPELRRRVPLARLVDKIGG